MKWTFGAVVIFQEWRHRISKCCFVILMFFQILPSKINTIRDRMPMVKFLSSGFWQALFSLSTKSVIFKLFCGIHFIFFLCRALDDAPPDGWLVYYRELLCDALSQRADNTWRVQRRHLNSSSVFHYFSFPNNFICSISCEKRFSIAQQGKLFFSLYRYSFFLFFKTHSICLMNLSHFGEMLWPKQIEFTFFAFWFELEVMKWKMQVVF